jgi:hypothetical protein
MEFTGRVVSCADDWRKRHKTGRFLWETKIWSHCSTVTSFIRQWLHEPLAGPLGRGGSLRKSSPALIHGVGTGDARRQATGPSILGNARKGTRNLRRLAPILKHYHSIVFIRAICLRHCVDIGDMRGQALASLAVSILISLNLFLLTQQQIGDFSRNLRTNPFRCVHSFIHLYLFHLIIVGITLP